MITAVATSMKFGAFNVSSPSSASVTDIQANVAVLDPPATASRLDTKHNNITTVRAPLVLAFQMIDEVAEYSATHRAEWASISVEAVATAKNLLTRLYIAVAQIGELWQFPHTSSDAEGGISFEWWNQERALTLFAYGDESTSFLYAWGLNIWTEMETGENPDDARLVELWLRLNRKT